MIFFLLSLPPPWLASIASTAAPFPNPRYQHANEPASLPLHGRYAESEACISVRLPPCAGFAERPPLGEKKSFLEGLWNETQGPARENGVTFFLSFFFHLFRFGRECTDD